MDKSKRVIVVLLVLAILFSVASIYISVSVSNLNLPRGGVSGNAVGNSGGGISLVVESSNSRGGE